MLGGSHVVEVVGRASDPDEACRQIRLLCPDVVIFDSRDPLCDPGSILVRLMRENPGMRIIGLNLQDETLCTYSGEIRMAQDIETVVDAIVR